MKFTINFWVENSFKVNPFFSVFNLGYLMAFQKNK